MAGELGLLKRFRRPVRILDVVKEECIRFRDKPGANELAALLTANDDTHYRTVTTPGHLERYRRAVAKEDAGDTERPSQGIGDEAITWYLGNVSRIEHGHDVVLVLLEDAPFGDGGLLLQNPEVAVLSTRAFLRTLQNFGLLHSANDVLKRVEVNSAGERSVSRYMADRPGRLARGVRSEWKSVLSSEDDGPGARG